MRSNPLNSFLLSACLAGLLMECHKDSPVATVNDLSPFARKFLTLNSGANSAAGGAKTATINHSFNGSMNVAQGFPGNGSTAGDSTIVGEPIRICAVVTEYDNPDGSHTTIYDYGNGCKDGSGDYQSIQWGKWIQTTKNTYETIGTSIVQTYHSHFQYVQYGGKYYFNNDSTQWSLDGSSTYDGKSAYDTMAQTFSGTFDYSDTTQYASGKDSYSYLGVGKSFYDQTKSVTEKNVYEYSSGDNYYKSEVTAPLVYDYSCSSGGGISVDMMFWFTYVSGHEVVHYRQDGKEGMFEIDYGNGACDNLITVIENGHVIVIDLQKDWPVLSGGGGNPQPL